MKEIKCWKYDPFIPLKKENLKKLPPDVVLSTKRSIMKTGIKAFFSKIKPHIMNSYLEGEKIYLFVEGCGLCFKISSISKNDKIIYLSKENMQSVKPKIFLSFQSDHPKTSLDIEKIIELIVLELKQFNFNEDINEIELDKAHKKGEGAHNLNETIKRKIKNCVLFVGDCTVISTYKNSKKQTKYSLNSNVCIEIGYAFATKDPTQILLVCPGVVNSQNKIKDLDYNLLPFDIKALHIAGLDNFADEFLTQILKMYRLKLNEYEDLRTRIHSKISEFSPQSKK